MRQPCTSQLHAIADINGYFEYVKKNSKYNFAHNTNGQHYPQQCSSDKLNFIHAWIVLQKKKENCVGERFVK